MREWKAEVIRHRKPLAMFGVGTGLGGEAECVEVPEEWAGGEGEGNFLSAVGSKSWEVGEGRMNSRGEKSEEDRDGGCGDVGRERRGL